MKLTQYQKDALLVLRTTLNPNDPQNTIADDLKGHLRALRPFFDGVVLTAIDVIDSPKEYEHRWMREAVSERARRIRLAQKRGAHSPDPWPPIADFEARRKGGDL